MALLEIQNLRMYYDTLRGQVKAVDNISFEMTKGQAFGLAGESGCGKTSTALAILRLLPSNGKIVEGKIEFDGVDLTKMKDETFRKDIRWKRISMIFQGAMNALHPTKSIGDQIIEAVLAHEDIGKDKAIERTGRLLDLVGVKASRMDRYPHELSGGMKQRTVTAMALVCNPDLVIADEPTTALDVIIQAQVLRVIIELKSKLNLSMILITHDLSMIAETCERMAVMYAGKIVEIGDVRSIFKKPLHPYTEKLIGAFPSVTGGKKELSSIHGFPPDLLNPPAGCRFHPRCTLAKPICRDEDPEITLVDRNHHVACHLVK